jgi:hypothetical protein
MYMHAVGFSTLFELRKGGWLCNMCLQDVR